MSGSNGSGGRESESESECESKSEPELELVGIVAVAENGVIGRDGEMPWHLPADLRHFKQQTTGHPVIMGRVTFESILEGLGEPLPNRTSIVLTSGSLEAVESESEPESEFDRVQPVHSISDAVEAAKRAANAHGTTRAFVAGGATVYEQFLESLDRLIVTEVVGEPDGDTFFPAWDRSAWREVSRDERDGFAFVEYERFHSVESR